MAAEDYTGASPVQGVTEPEVPGLLHGCADRERHRLRRLRRRCERTHGTGRRSASSATTTPSSGTRATTSSPASRVGLRERIAPRHPGAVRGPRLPQRGRQGALHRQVRRGTSTPPAIGTQLYDPFANAAVLTLTRRSRRCCRPLAGSGDGVNDVLEYWFGASVLNDGAGLDENGDPFDVVGVGGPRSTASTLDLQRRRQRRQPGSSTRRSSRRAACCPSPTTRSSTSRASPRTTTGRVARSSRTRATLRVLADRGHLVQAPDAHDQRARRWRDDDLLDLVRHRARLGPRVRRGAHRRPGRLDHAAGCRTAIRARPRARAARPRTPAAGGPSTHSSITTRPRTATRRALPTGTTGAVERRLGQLRRLAAVGGRPRRIRGQAGRGLDLVRQRLGEPGSRRLHRRHRGPDRRGTSFETGLEGWTSPASPPAARRTRTTSASRRPPAVPRGAVVTTADTIYMGFGSRGHHRCRGPERCDGPGHGVPLGLLTAVSPERRRSPERSTLRASIPLGRTSRRARRPDAHRRM